MKEPPFEFQSIKVIALAVRDLERAERFYGETLGLPPAYEGTARVGFGLGPTVLMLKADWYAAPTDMLNPRVTLAVADAPATEKALKERGIVVSDPVQVYDEFYVGSFLDSEGNKLWFCSPIRREDT
jgi:catechol 2,3-dioxygenase-like lactoylglutathione lyase family enzyme